MKETLDIMVPRERTHIQQVGRVSKVEIRNKIQSLMSQYETTEQKNCLIMAAILKAYYIALGGQKGIILKNVDKKFVIACKHAFTRLMNKSRLSQEHCYNGKLTKEEIIYLSGITCIEYFDKLGNAETIFMNKVTVREAFILTFYRR